MRVLAIDPGVTTGFCYAELISRDTGGGDWKLVSHLEFFPTQFADEVDDLWRRLEHFEPRYIIIESFEFRKQSRGGLNLFPNQLIGVTNLYGLMAKHQCAVVEQTAATGKGYYTDPLLKKNNAYIPGKPHANDATRHLLQWFTFGSGFQFNSKQQDFFKRIETMKWL